MQCLSFYPLLLSITEKLIAITMQALGMTLVMAVVIIIGTAHQEKIIEEVDSVEERESNGTKWSEEGGEGKIMDDPIVPAATSQEGDPLAYNCDQVDYKCQVEWLNRTSKELERKLSKDERKSNILNGVYILLAILYVLRELKEMFFKSLELAFLSWLVTLPIMRSLPEEFSRTLQEYRDRLEKHHKESTKLNHAFITLAKTPVAELLKPGTSAAAEEVKSTLCDLGFGAELARRDTEADCCGVDDKAKETPPSAIKEDSVAEEHADDDNKDFAPIVRAENQVALEKRMHDMEWTLGTLLKLSTMDFLKVESKTINAVLKNLGTFGMLIESKKNETGTDTAENPDPGPEKNMSKVGSFIQNVKRRFTRFRRRPN